MSPRLRSPVPERTHRTLEPAAALSRRRFVAAATATAAAALAGCAGVVDYLGGLVLDDVNVFNASDRPLAGDLEVSGPDGSVLLEASFEVDPDEDDDEVEEDSGATFDDVLDDPGEYVVSVRLDDDSADDETETETTVSVDDPDDEHVIVVLGAEETDAAVDVFVIEEFSELPERLEEE